MGIWFIDNNGNETLLKSTMGENQMKFTIRQCRMYPKRGWYIVVNEKRREKISRFVWKDLELHIGTGYGITGYTPDGYAPGYYNSEIKAENYLRLFKEKHNMAENIEITVKVNGVATPLHEISKQTLLTVRENSKSEKIPVVRVGNYGSSRRLVLKVPSGIGQYEGKMIAINLETENIVDSWTFSEDNKYRGTLYYRDIQVIS